ncbi:MAG: toll/interleukin-1 receptor domain-containing protein [Ktedonobacterales bacterium]
MADVFSSYSRRDRAYIDELRPSLEAYKRSVWVDLRAIPPSADWRDEIHQAIISSDAFICVISPDYVASPICQEELEFARANNKRLIPVVRRDIPTNQAPPALAALNWIFFRETDNQSAAFGKLLSALDTDLPYVRSGSRLLVRAKEWETKGRNASFMLRGKDLSEAEQWLASSGGKQPPPIARSPRASGVSSSPIHPTRRPADRVVGCIRERWNVMRRPADMAAAGRSLRSLTQVARGG